MKKTIILPLLFAIYFCNATAQTGFEIRVDSFSVGNYQPASNILGTLDGGFMSLGRGYSWGTFNVYILKFNNQGVFEWGKYYASTSFAVLNPFKIVQFPDSGYAISYRFESDPVWNLDSWAMLKIDKNGNVIPGVGAMDSAYSGQSTNLGWLKTEIISGRIFLRGVSSNSSSDKLLSFDSSFNNGKSYVFNQTINPGVFQTYYFNFLYLNNVLTSMICNTHYNGLYNFYFTTKLDTSGNAAWQKTYKTVLGNSNLVAKDFIQIDSFYYNIGQTMSNKSFFHKTDLYGNTRACIFFDSIGVYKIAQSAPSELLILGYWNTIPMILSVDTSGNVISCIKQNTLSNPDYFDTKTKSLLTITSTIPSNQFNIRKTYINSGCGISPVTITTSTGAIIDSTVNFPMIVSSISSHPLQLNDYPLSVTSSNVCLATSSIYEEKEDAAFTIYPNPTGDLLTINLPVLKPKLKGTIKNLTGQTVLGFNISDINTTLRVDKLIAGFYVIEINGVASKIIKL